MPDDGNRSDNIRLTLVSEKITKQVYCSHGAHHTYPSGGFWKRQSNGRKRFVCAACRKRSNEGKEKTA